MITCAITGSNGVLGKRLKKILPCKFFELKKDIRKIKSAKKKIVLKNLNNYRDFLNTKDIVYAIDTLRKNEASRTYNIGSGINFDLRGIARIFAIKYKKKIAFRESKKCTYLIANNTKIKKLGWMSSKYNKNVDYFYK